MSSLPSCEPPLHAVARLFVQRQAQSTRPFLARGGPSFERCPRCRLRSGYCLCPLHPALATHAGVCLLMHDAEPLKPSNTGWLIADVLADTHAFGWTRTAVDPALLQLLADPQWAPHVVFPAAYAPPHRVVNAVAPEAMVGANRALGDRRPLFVVLDGTWAQACKMFHKSPYLDGFPVLSLAPEQASRYQLRRVKHAAHWCTSEVASLCLAMTDAAQDLHAARVLSAHLDVFSQHYLKARLQQPVDWQSTEHQQLAALWAQATA